MPESEAVTVEYGTSLVSDIVFSVRFSQLGGSRILPAADRLLGVPCSRTLWAEVVV